LNISAALDAAVFRELPAVLVRQRIVLCREWVSPAFARSIPHLLRVMNVSALPPSTRGSLFGAMLTELAVK
jgi:hypothetical protein